MGQDSHDLLNVKRHAMAPIHARAAPATRTHWIINIRSLNEPLAEPSRERIASLTLDRVLEQLPQKESCGYHGGGDGRGIHATE